MTEAPRRLTLRRLSGTDVATYGHLEDADGKVLCCTLEEPWRNNERSISCIPPGEYTAHRRLSPKRNAELFELDAVPGRSNIEIHVGNTTADTEGCILVGTSFGTVNGQHGIVESRAAFKRFMQSLAGVQRIALTVLPALEEVE